jgi:hypothetical protein
MRSQPQQEGRPLISLLILIHAHGTQDTPKSPIRTSMAGLSMVHYTRYHRDTPTYEVINAERRCLSRSCRHGYGCRNALSANAH